MKILAPVLLFVSIAGGAEAAVPPAIAGQLPLGYEVIAEARLAAGQPMRSFEIVALARTNETELVRRSQQAPARPLIVFEQKGGRFVPVGRNDHVVLKADEGGQCDPFLDGATKIAIKGRYFTIENGVACGQHWTDYITFRLDDAAGGFVFDNERREAWEFNPSESPDAEALVRSGPAHVIRSPSGQVVSFARWRPID